MLVTLRNQRLRNLVKSNERCIIHSWPLHNITYSYRHCHILQTSHKILSFFLLHHFLPMNKKHCPVTAVSLGPELLGALPRCQNWGPFYAPLH